MPETSPAKQLAITPSTLRQRLLLEELLRQRRPSDHDRYIETFRRSAVDPNPHQVEAVAFALGRLADGGALLCDEVGLGKTIETGLLLTQLRAEGKRHVLIVVPVPLARQWQVELKDLFGLPSMVIGAKNLADSLDPGIFICGREFAGSAKWAPQLAARGPWDLVVIDEAHECISSIYRRFGKRTGEYLDVTKKGPAHRAAWIKTIVGDAPALLLTATPLQNSLFELWGLVHFVDPKSTVLGELHEFSQLFTGGEGRVLRPERQAELRSRLRAVLCRTLRAQAQPFLRLPFTARHCETINFHMEAIERELYQGVSDWLSRRVAAYRPQHQGLMTLMLRRRMGSSVHALASTLNNVLGRLRDEDPDSLLPEDVDEELIEDDIREVTRLRSLAARALKGPSPKLEKLWELVERVGHGAQRGVASDKVVIFTESRKTLESIVDFLEGRGLKGQVTAFSGTNDTAAAQQALQVWQRDVGAHLDPSQRPEPASAMRAALVHEFKTRTRVLVATESGAKGLNLQFCNCLVNFDLPWNPQRVEQRIGRVHRYGQAHDVVIVNFINLDNEGEERVYHILRDKLQLFEGLFGASDSVLGQVASVLDFERRVQSLWTACRTPAERQLEFERLELELDEQQRRLRDARLEEARGLIASLDSDVQARLRLTAEALPQAMSRRDEAFLDLLHADSPIDRLHTGQDRVVFTWRGARYHLGPPDPSETNGEPIDLSHPLLASLIGRVRAATQGALFRVEGEPADWEIHRVTITGLETEERLLVLGGLPELENALRAAREVRRIDEAWSESDALASALDELQAEAEQEQAPRVNRLLAQLADRRQDARRCLEQREADLERKLADAERKRRTARTPAEQRSAETSSRRLRTGLESLRAGRAEQLREAARTLARLEDDLHERRYVTVTSELLFRVERT